MCGDRNRHWQRGKGSQETAASAKCVSEDAGTRMQTERKRRAQKKKRTHKGTIQPVSLLNTAVMHYYRTVGWTAISLCSRFKRGHG